MKLGVTLLALCTVCTADEAEKAYEKEKASVRLHIAKAVYAHAAGKLSTVKAHVAAGTLSTRALGDVQLLLHEAYATRQRAEVDLEEVSVTGKAPRDELAAPVVGGRDYVRARLEFAADAWKKIHAVHVRRAEEARGRLRTICQ